jgi:hypothetical protein
MKDEGLVEKGKAVLAQNLIQNLNSKSWQFVVLLSNFFEKSFQTL